VTERAVPVREETSATEGVSRSKGDAALADGVPHGRGEAVAPAPYAQGDAFIADLVLHGHGDGAAPMPHTHVDAVGADRAPRPVGDTAAPKHVPRAHGETDTGNRTPHGHGEAVAPETVPHTHAETAGTDRDPRPHSEAAGEAARANHTPHTHGEAITPEHVPRARGGVDVGRRPPHTDGDAATTGHASHPHPHGGAPPTPTHAALIHGQAVPKARVDAFLAAVPARDRETRPEALARAERQRRRWATQVVVTDELARRACGERGLKPPEEVSPSLVLAVAETDVADLGSIVAAALAHSPAARVLLAELEGEQDVGEADVRDYYERNRDRFLTSDALRRGVDPFVGDAADFLPYPQVRDAIAGESRRAAGRRAFFDWLDRARAGVEYAVGHEHPGDPSHPDHEHRH
jgi:hypothetical protein